MPADPPPLQEAPPPTPVDVASGRFLGKLLLLFIASLLACILTYLALTLPGAWFSGASTKIWPPQNMVIARGAAVGVESGRAHLAPEPNGLAVLTVNARFPARDYPVLDWDISGLPDGTAAKLLWRTDYAPNAQRQADLTIENGRLLPVTVAHETGWLGNVLGFGIALQLPMSQSFTVVNLRARSMDAPETLSLRIKEWCSFPGWRGTSIFKLEDPGLIPLSLLIIAAFALLFLGAALLFFWRRWRDRYIDFPRAMPRHWFYGGMVLLCIGWLVLDARWTIQLARQAAQTWQSYGEKDLTQKRLAAEDGALFAFINNARAELPENPVRIFIMAEISYLRSRAAYHLYPNNVFYDLHSTQPPDARFLRPGDYVLVFQQRGIQYNAAKKKIRLPSGAEFSADAKIIGAGSALFELTP
ncbi:MAG: hypothetical protein LBE32_00625 [Burkholderiales bacterium]|nr:hypothetical protein [Burkholderiales bacterium]